MMRSLLKILKKINKIFWFIFWYPIDKPLFLWLKGYYIVKHYFSFSFSNYINFVVKYIPSLDFFYTTILNNKFFNWWIKKNIYQRFFLLYIFLCFILAFCYSFFEIHLLNLVETLAVSELTWLNSFQTSDEWIFFAQFLWTPVYILLYLLQVFFFACLIFYFITTVGSFWLLFLTLNYFVFLDMFVPNAYHPLHITILNSWHIIACVALFLFCIVVCRFFFVRFKIKNPKFTSNFWVFIFILIKSKCIKLFTFFWKSSLTKKLGLFICWVFLINFGLLFLITLIKLLFIPASTGEFFWLLIVNVFSKIHTWDNFFLFPWTRLFQVFISIAINVLYDFVFYFIAFSSIFLLLYIFSIQVFNFFLLVLYFPMNFSLYLEYIKNFFQIFSFISLIKKWIPALRDYCYAAILFNTQGLSYYVQGVKKRRTQRPYWKIYFQNKADRRKTSLYHVFYDYFINNLSSKADYKNFFINSVERDKKIWTLGQVYGKYLRLIKKTKGMRGRNWLFYKKYIIFFKTRFFFYFKQWQRNPGILGHLIFNPSFSIFFSKLKIYFCIWNYYVNNVFLGGCFFYLFYFFICCFTVYIIFFKWYILGLILFTSLWYIFGLCFPSKVITIHEDLLYKQKNNIYFFITFCFVYFLSLLCFVLFNTINYFLSKLPSLYGFILIENSHIYYIYDKSMYFINENKVILLQEKFLSILWFFFFFNVFFIYLILVGNFLLSLDFLAKKFKTIWVCLSKLFSTSLVFLLLFPLILTIDGFFLFFCFTLDISVILAIFCLPFILLLAKIFGFSFNTQFSNFHDNSNETDKLIFTRKHYFLMFCVFGCLLIFGSYIYWIFLCG